MDLLGLIVAVAVVSVSGALTPGPLFFATLSHATKSGAKGGLAVSVGHTLVEFPLVILLALGLLTVADEPIIKLSTGLAGGAALLLFGFMQVRGSLTSKSGASGNIGVLPKNPVFLGLVFTSLNPFFILWWLTIGGRLILESLGFASLIGVLLMYVSHVWMDYAWLIAVAYLAKRGTSIVGTRGHSALTAIFGVALIYFGLAFLASILGVGS